MNEMTTLLALAGIAGLLLGLGLIGVLTWATRVIRRRRRWQTLNSAADKLAEAARNLRVYIDNPANYHGQPTPPTWPPAGGDSQARIIALVNALTNVQALLATNAYPPFSWTTASSALKSANACVQPLVGATPPADMIQVWQAHADALTLVADLRKRG